MVRVMVTNRTNGRHGTVGCDGPVGCAVTDREARAVNNRRDRGGGDGRQMMSFIALL